MRAIILLALLYIPMGYCQTSINGSGTTINNGTDTSTLGTITGMTTPEGVIPCDQNNINRPYIQISGSLALQWSCTQQSNGTYSWSALSTSTPEKRYAGSTGVDAFVPVMAQACSSPIDCVVNSTSTLITSGISIDSGQPGAEVHILQHGPALCKFLNQPAQNDSTLVGVGGCLDSPLSYYQVDSKQGYIGKVLQVVDSSHAYVNIIYPGAVGLSIKTSSLVNDLNWGQSTQQTSPVFLTLSGQTIDLSSCQTAVPCFVTYNLLADSNPTISGIKQGMMLYLSVCNGTNSYVWTAPSLLHGSMINPIGPNTCNVQPFTSFNGLILMSTSGGVNEAS